MCAKASSPSFSQNSPSLPQNSVSLSEFSSPKQYSRNSIPPVSYFKSHACCDFYEMNVQQEFLFNLKILGGGEWYNTRKVQEIQDRDLKIADMNRWTIQSPFALVRAVVTYLSHRPLFSSKSKRVFQGNPQTSSPSTRAPSA